MENMNKIIENYTNSLVSAYLNEKVINNPKVSERIRKAVEKELEKLVKVEVL